ncbi:MAG: hypothetical protein OEY56_13090, partial [Cyclobacteriaceae bacterium]|nr:hypothetical protein [Cyclobacteriaceae bacterium]
IWFDTLLTQRTSITKRFRVYNQHENAVLFDEIKLGKGSLSDFHLTINGEAGYAFENLQLNGKDSLLILLSSTIDPQNKENPYLIKDSVLFRWNENIHDVKLIAWGQDAYFHPKGYICNENWLPGKAHVILDTLVVDKNCLLQIDAGSQVLFDKNAALFVLGKLEVRGDSGRRVTFRNTRFDQAYKEAPGQWDAIYFLEGSTGNLIDFAVIENARIGLRIGTPDQDTLPDVTVKHTIIRHISQSGIQAFTSDVSVENSLIYNAGKSIVFHAAGGNYAYNHCTFVNTPSFFVVDEPACQFADNLIRDKSVLTFPLSVEITNSILWSGNSESDLLFSITDSTNNFIRISNNIIFSQFSVTGNTTSDNHLFPIFQHPFSFDFRLDSISPARNVGMPSGLKDDLNGMPRDTKPDLGAIEWRQD